MGYFGFFLPFALLLLAVAMLIALLALWL